MLPASASPRSGRSFHRVWRSVFFLIALGVVCRTAPANELGHPIFQDFPPGRSNIGFFIQAMTQDATGTLYAGAFNHIRHYDGTRWHPIPTTSESAAVRKFARTDDGTIYAGGASLIGFLRGSGPGVKFVSLEDRLPPTELGCDELFDVLAVGNTVYFADEEKILRWRDEKFTVIPCRTPPRSQGARLHRIGDVVYVTALDHPLYRLTDDRLVVVVDDPAFRQNQIISLEAGPDGSLAALTAERGFFQLAAGRVAPLPSDVNRWVAGKKILRALRLGDGSLAVVFTAPTGDGGVLFDATGRYLSPIDHTIGLYTKTVRNLFSDREGGLWLCTEVGAFRLEWPSALTLFDAVNGLGAGSVTALARHDGALHAATSEGVFRLLPGDAAGRVARFERIYGHPAFALVSDPRGLLIVGYSSLMLHSPTGFVPLADLPPGGGILHRSKRDPQRIWIGTTVGLQSIRSAPEGWRNEGRVPEFSAAVQALTEAPDGALWISTPKSGLFRLELHGTKPGQPPTRVEQFTGGNGLPERFARSNLANWAGEPVVFVNSTARPFRFDSQTRRFTAFSNTESLPAGPFAESWTAGGSDSRAADTLWLAAPPGIYRVPRAAGEPRRLPQLALTTVGGTVTCLREETGPEDSILWVGGAKGLVRVDVTRAFVAPVPFTAHLKSAEVREGGRLEPEHAPLKFDYIAWRHQIARSVSYQTRLFGHETEWSPWSLEAERVFNRLSPGRYRFEVRARDADQHLSAPASLSFVVLLPWWRTWWALLGYVAVGTGAVTGVVRLRTRALRERAERLEAVVEKRTHELAQRTSELAQKNIELTRLHQLELDEKIAARLAEEKARLEVLRYQLNPHFLFNTLASISSALPSAQSTARTMVERLASFCRLTLHRTDDREWTTLGEEVQLLRTYLEIEQSRWGDLLDVAIDCDTSLEAERLPHFLLLPLIENALKYGRATSPDRVGLRLTARRDSDSTLVLEVANTGTWIEPTERKTVSSLGIGLDNLRERLGRYYPRTHELTLAHAAGWVTVTLRLASQYQERGDSRQAAGEP